MGRRAAGALAIAVPIAPIYLLTGDFSCIFLGYLLQGAFGGALYSQLPSYLSERFPTEGARNGECLLLSSGCDLWRAGAGGADLLGRIFPVGLVIPMLLGTVAAATSVVIALLINPETKGTVLVPDLQVA
jgi:MFS transporter, SHS family, lactate transporter